MNITVTNCNDCPFSHVEYDDFAMGDSHTQICGLAHYKRQPESIINTFNLYGEGEIKEVPEWCPLDEVRVTRKRYKFMPKR